MGFFNQLIEVFGEEPSVEDFKDVSDRKIGQLRQELANWSEVDVKIEDVREVLKMAIANNCGADFAD